MMIYDKQSVIRMLTYEKFVEESLKRDLTNTQIIKAFKKKFKVSESTATDVVNTILRLI